MHYYQFNIADYRKDTAHLKPLEHYIYRQLIDWYFLDEKPINKSLNLVIRRLNLDQLDHTHLLENVLLDFFTEEEDGFHHKRIDAEIKEYKNYLDKQSSNGKKGGRPPKIKTQINPPLNLDNPNLTQKKPNQELLTTNHKPTTKKKRVKRFEPPSYEDVLSHCNDPNQSSKFINHYESNGWRVGKNKMVNWKAALTNWMKRQEEYSNGNHTKPYKTNSEQFEEDLTESELYLQSLIN